MRHNLTDSEAISTWERAEQPPDPNDSGPAQPYRCTVCAWTGRGETALRHYRATGHAIRGRDWPATWPNAQYSFPPDPVSVCAWCSDAKQRTADAVLAGRDVTHGMCEKCRAAWMDRR